MSYPGQAFDEQARGLLCPANYQNPTPQARYHLVVIGAGPAGLIASIGAAGLGAKVALVEADLMGGDCLNVGCVPSKALLEYTHRKQDFDGAFEWLRQVRAGIAPHDSVERYSELGVDVFLGKAKLDSQGSVVVCVADQETTLSSRRVAICTGAKAAIPPIPGLQEAAVLTNETLFDLTECPQRLAILGAGVIGCEMATVFARLGVEVHLFEMADRVMPQSISRASRGVAASLEALGVHLHLGEAVSEVSGSPAAATIHVGAKTVTGVDKILVALGRAPNTGELNLAAAGVSTDVRGFIETDRRLRSSNKRIYAAGDCAAELQFTHHADAQARVLVQNAIIAPSASVDKFNIPSCTYTVPEVANVGLALEVADDHHDLYEFELGDLDRVRSTPGGEGYAQVVTPKGKDQILGATIVAPDAGELLAPRI